MYYIFSFRSRNQSMRFYDALKIAKIGSKIISTPSVVSVGCGLSVQVSSQNISVARQVFCASKYDTFIGLFYINGTNVTRVTN